MLQDTCLSAAGPVSPHCQEEARRYGVHGTSYVKQRLEGVRGMTSTDSCTCFAINPMRLSCRRDLASKTFVYSNYPSSNHNEHDVCFCIPGS
jgi:hypothetical protein